MTKLIYVTRTAVPSQAAQSVQILAMSKAFHHVMGKNFRLVSGKGAAYSPRQFDIFWEQKSIPKNSLLRHLKFCSIALNQVFSERDSVIFTRDIAIAFSVVCSGRRAVYEAHNSPVGKAAIIMTRSLALSSRFQVVAISHALAQYYIEKYRFPSNRVLIAHDGVFPEDYHPLDRFERENIRKELNLPIDKLLVVHTGSLYKGGAELFEYVATAGGSEVEIIQVGGTPEEQSFWSRYYADIGIENIRFIEHQPTERIKLYQLSADLLFYVNTRNSPIYWCTSPLKLFEYMATGVPILGSSLGSVGEVINETNAFCYDPDHPSSIIEAWKEFKGDPAGASRRAAKARKEAESMYSWYQRAERIITFTFSDKKGK